MMKNFLFFIAIFVLVLRNTMAFSSYTGLTPAEIAWIKQEAQEQERREAELDAQEDAAIAQIIAQDKAQAPTITSVDLEIAAQIKSMYPKNFHNITGKPDLNKIAIIIASLPIRNGESRIGYQQRIAMLGFPEKIAEAVKNQAFEERKATLK